MTNLLCSTFSQPDHSPFADGVRRAIFISCLSSDTCGVNDGAGPFHITQLRNNGILDPIQIYAKKVIPVFVCNCIERMGSDESRHVCRSIEAAEFLSHDAHSIVNRFAVSHITNKGNTFTTNSLKLLQCIVWAVTVQKTDVRTLASKPDRQVPTHPGGCTRDNESFSL